MVCTLEYFGDCVECGECSPDEYNFDHFICPGCKGVNVCSCDEQYQAYKERERL